MKEIGGYLELDNFIHQEYYPELISLNNGRNALAYLIKTNAIKKLYIPYLLCDSISKLCERENCSYEYYHVDDTFQPVFSKKLYLGEYLYIVNYYGQVQNELALKNKYGNIIFDNTHAFFQRPIEGIDTIYSCRKFFGVPDGAYLSTEKTISKSLATDISHERMIHILGRYEGNASEYYSYFKDNDISFVDLEMKYMSRLTKNLLGAIDYEFVRNRRNSNFKILYDKLSSYNDLKIIPVDGPFAFPIYLSNGMEIKARLAKKKIYVATLWPNVLKFDGIIEKKYAENILPLPCDQRYDKNDMLYLCEEVLKCIN